MTGMDLLELAQALAHMPTDGVSPHQEEARLRAAISRAYYATFWEARALLLAEGETLPRLDAHQVLIGAFQRSPYRVRQTIGHHLGRLRAERNEADYQRSLGELPTLRAKAQRVLDRAGRVLTSLAQLAS